MKTYTVRIAYDTAPHTREVADFVCTAWSIADACKQAKAEYVKKFTAITVIYAFRVKAHTSLLHSVGV